MANPALTLLADINLQLYNTTNVTAYKTFEIIIIIIIIRNEYYYSAVSQKNFEST